MPCYDDQDRIESNRHNSELAAYLCAVMVALEDNGHDHIVPPAVLDWWAEHKARDARRKTAEEAAFVQAFTETEAEATPSTPTAAPAKPTGPALLTDDELFDLMKSVDPATVRVPRGIRGFATEIERVVRERCQTYIAAAAADSFAQQQGALLWIACMVDKCGGTVVLSAAEQLRAKELILERGDLEDGTTVLRTEEPPRIELAPTEIAVASKKIILAL